MGVMAVLGLVLDGGSVNSNTTGAFFRGGIDFVVLLGGAVAHGGQGHGESGSESGLAVVDMADSPDVYMGLSPLEFSPGSSNGERATPRGDGGGRRGGKECGGGFTEKGGGEGGGVLTGAGRRVVEGEGGGGGRRRRRRRRWVYELGGSRSRSS